MPTYHTITKIAAREGVDRHRIEYLILSRDIKPIARVGNVCVYSDADADYIVTLLRRNNVKEAINAN